MAPLEIHVTGKGTTYRPAERAILVLQVSSSKASTAQEASTIVTSIAKTIRDMITPFCPSDNSADARQRAAIAHYSMGALQTSNNTQPKRISNDRTAGVTEFETLYSAKVSFNIKFSDFTVLGRLATEFSAMKHVSVSRIDWKLTEDNEKSIHSETRRKAAYDLVSRANDYAVAVAGVPEAELKERVKAASLNENQYYTYSTRAHLHNSKSMMTHEVNHELLEFQPEDVSLEISVEGKFIVD